MARLSTAVARNKQATPPTPRPARSAETVPAYPRMALNLRPATLSRKSSPPPALLTVLGLLFISASLFFDPSVVQQLTTALSAPLPSVISVRPLSPTMPHSSKSAKPPSKKELGNAGWTLIHSIAANYPQAPTPNDQYHAKAFLRSIGKLYPCKRCRHHFDRYLAASPPDLSSRDQFMLWACGAHNAVNRRQGKVEFPCRMSKLEQRWGDCGCQLKTSTKK